MIAFALTVFFAFAALASLGVLVVSYARGVAAFNEQRRALMNCNEIVTVTVRVIDHRAPRMRIVCSNLTPLPVSQLALRAAA